MGSTKWITGFLGWVAFGPIGGLIGFLLGKAVETYIDGARQLPGGDDTYTQQGSGQQYQRRTGPQYQQRTQRGGYTANEQRNSFFVSLLVLSFLRQNFGEQAAAQGMQILQQLGTQEINIYQVGGQISANMNYSQRLQLFHYLVNIATVDGDFAKAEKNVLEVIGSVIGLTNTDVASVIAMFYKEKGDESAYTILEISPSATDDEVRAAYRRMAMKYHPDRVSTLGEDVQKAAAQKFDVQKAAAQKFQQVHDAYEKIKKMRGMS